MDEDPKSEQLADCTGDNAERLEDRLQTGLGRPGRAAPTGGKDFRTLVAQRTAGLLAIAIAVWSVFAQGSKPQNVTASERDFASLGELMKDGLHERLTEISFRVWHDAPMTDQKMEMVEKSASQLRLLAGKIPSLRPAGPLWSEEQLLIFESKAAALGEVAQEMSQAAKRKDRPEVEKLFERLEATCNSCHAVFRKDLVTEYVEPPKH